MGGKAPAARRLPCEQRAGENDDAIDRLQDLVCQAAKCRAEGLQQNGARADHEGNQDVRTPIPAMKCPCPVADRWDELEGAG